MSLRLSAPAAAVCLSLALATRSPLLAQEVEAGKKPPKEAEGRFHLGGELKANFRDSAFEEVKDLFPFPASFIPPGQNEVFLRTVSRGSSLELANLALRGEGELASRLYAKAEVHFLDLYNRNPTSSDDRLLVREAWIRLGKAFEPLQPFSGNSAYVLVGLAPRFSKQVERGLESYGLWGTAVARFEQPQLQLGGTFGKHVSWRAHFGSGNPLFFRDPNALAGDNGTPEKVPGNVHPIYENGFPIMYDAKPLDITTRGAFEWGAGLGSRFTGKDDRALDVMAWYFQRRLADRVQLRGTFYSGDLGLLTFAFPLPVSGHKKFEYGLNLEARLKRLHLFGQYVNQDVAKLVRRGVELELTWTRPLNGLFLVGETPVGNWIQPVVRFSTIDNRFAVPPLFPGPSVGWDWRKYDLGLRCGVAGDVDLTLEYSLNSATVNAGTTIHPNEALITLRVSF